MTNNNIPRCRAHGRESRPGRGFQMNGKTMKKQMLALAAVTALSLSAQAQLFNWTLTTSGPGNSGNGSGRLTLTSGVITAMNGTIGGPGHSVSLLPQGDFGGNDNRLPLAVSMQ